MHYSVRAGVWFCVWVPRSLSHIQPRARTPVVIPIPGQGAPRQSDFLGEAVARALRRGYLRSTRLP
eukprot:5964816-Lingulodinium_polyedra.AAC.1